MRESANDKHEYAWVVYDVLTVEPAAVALVICALLSLARGSRCFFRVGRHHVGILLRINLLIMYLFDEFANEWLAAYVIVVAL